MSFEDDLSWFESNRAFIASTYQGQWVVVKDKAIKGSYPTDTAAMQAAFQMFGASGFVVKQAMAVEQIHQIPTKQT